MKSHLLVLISFEVYKLYYILKYYIRRRKIINGPCRMMYMHPLNMKPLHFVHCPLFREIRTFRRLELFPSSGEELGTRTLLDMIKRANIDSIPN
jgi:hypothetical protein